jgi:hypothetical protein
MSAAAKAIGDFHADHNIVRWKVEDAGPHTNLPPSIAARLSPTNMAPPASTHATAH